MKERFMKKVIILETGCWEWTASKDRKGYGMFSMGGSRNQDGTRRNSMTGAHRASYLIFNGDIPKHDSHHGICVLHKCDNPGCVNPEHLFLGTNMDNVHDMDAKGRRVTVSISGSQHANAVLNEKQVLEIKEIIKSKSLTQRQIAKMYGVANSTVNHIKTGRLWGNLTGVKLEKN